MEAGPGGVRPGAGLFSHRRQAFVLAVLFAAPTSTGVRSAAGRAQGNPPSNAPLTTYHAPPGVRLSGRVVKPGNGIPAPLVGAWAVLHRMGPAGSSPLDSVRTDWSGAYHFTVAGTDTTAQYVVGVQYSGVAYISGAAGPGRLSSRELDAFSVFDTSATQPVVLSQRHLLIQPANPDGTIPVLELLVLVNRGTRTRVGADSTGPTWHGRLLAGAFDVEVGEGDVGRDAVTHEGDAISVIAPLTPGEKQIVLTYVLPRKLAEVILPRSEEVGTLGVMIADTMARPEPGPLQARGIAGFENISYLRLEATDVPAGPPLSSVYPAPVRTLRISGG